MIDAINDNYQEGEKTKNDMFTTAMKWAQNMRDTTDFNAKMAALTVLSKVNLTLLSQSEMLQLVNSIDFDLIRHLLLGRGANKDVLPFDLQQVGAAVLGWVATVQQINCIPQLEACCREALYALHLLTDNVEARHVLADLLSYMSTLVQSEQGRKYLLESDNISYLVAVINLPGDMDVALLALNVLLTLFRAEPKSAIAIQSDLLCLVTILGRKCVQLTATNQLFTLIEQLGEVFSFISIPEDDKYYSAEFLEVVHLLCNSMSTWLRSKLLTRHKQACLMCLAQLMRHVGLDWLLSSGESVFGAKLVLLVCHLCTVELRMALDEAPSLNAVTAQSSVVLLLLACFSVLEEVVKALLSENNKMQNEPFVELISKVTPLLHSVAQHIVDFLKRCLPEIQGKIHPFGVACLKIVGLLVTVETSLELECVVELFPFFAIIFNTDYLVDIGSDEIPNGLLISFFVPFFINHTSSVEGCANLFKYNVLSSLSRYFVLKWHDVRNSVESAPNSTGSNAEHLMSVAHVFINIALVQHKHTFKSVEKNLLSDVLHVTADSLSWLFDHFELHSQLALTMLTLGVALLLTLKHNSASKEAPNCLCGLLVVRAVRFLATDSLERKDNVHGIWKLRDSLASDWSDCSSLWHLSCQLLSDAASKLTWVRQLLEHSGCRENIENSLPELRRDLNSEYHEIVQSLTTLFKAIM